MNRYVILADMAVAALGTAAVIFGANGDAVIHKLALLWGGLCLGYVVTVYLNSEDL
jgi:hypothetical protein